MAAWTCEISGEALGATQDEIVVTPSGHVCIRRLLLTKLAENGGMDPFETMRELPLSEEQLVTLAASTTASSPSSSLLSAAAPPRPQQATSLPNLLRLAQTEYDSLVLELFDTRKALEETRRELSQALYQNDAAVRVVARLAQERDAARQELERWSASVGVNGGGGGVGVGGGGSTKNGTPLAPVAATAATATAAANATATATTSAPATEDGEDAIQAGTKRRRLDPSAGPLENDLPADDWQTLQDTWDRCSTGRKAMLKAAAARAPPPEALAKYDRLEQKAWHKSANRGIFCMAKTALDGGGQGLIVTAGKDRHLVVYSEADQVVKHTLAFGAAYTTTTAVDISASLVVAGDSKGKLAVFSLEGDDSGSSLGELNLGAAIVDVTVHPSQQHILAATQNGKVIVIACSAATKSLQQVAYFQREGADVEDVYTCACLHPDGLIYAVGTKKGEIQVWDLKNKLLAVTLKEGEEEDGLSAIAISNNGYQIAAGHDSASLHIWDLRKQKTVTTLKDLLKSVGTVAYDESGKYLAVGGEGGVTITTVKEWGTTARIDTKTPVSGIVWSESTMEICSEKERAVSFYGVSES